MPKDTLSATIERELAEDAAAIAEENARLRTLVRELVGALESAGHELRYLRTRRDLFYRLSFNKAEADGFLNAQAAIHRALTKARTQ